jgi:phage terminase small subunit
VTPKQKRFTELYLLSLNATQAYMEAYGASEPVAKANGSRLLTNANVAAAIANAQQKRSERVEITADQILKDLYLNSQLARDEGKYADSNKALELCDKHLGTLIDRLHVTTDANEAAAELASLLGLSVEQVMLMYGNDDEIPVS